MGWLVAYDIASPRRWRRVYRRLRSVGFRIQYSLFWADITGAEAAALARELEGMIDLKADDVRFYHLPDDAAVAFYGPSPWPSGVDHVAARRFAGCFSDPPPPPRHDRHGSGGRSLKT